MSDPYIFLFTSNVFLRKSCYHCKFKGLHSRADIIVGDYHASIKEAGNWGCSCVMAITAKGIRIIEKLDGVKKKINSCDIADYNPMIYKSVHFNHQRIPFFSMLGNNEIDAIFKIFLPKRFYIKKFLNFIGLFRISRKFLKVTGFYKAKLQ